MSKVLESARKVHPGGAARTAKLASSDNEPLGISGEAFCLERIKKIVENNAGLDATKVLDECFVALQRRLPADPPRPTFNRITAAELAAGRYEVSYIIDDVLVEGQPAGIIGPPKSLKTSLLLAAAIAIDQGGHFLGRFPVRESRRVCVFSGESGLATIQETCKRICLTSGCDLGSTGIVFSDTLPRLGDKEHMHELEKFLRDEGTQVAFFDPWYLMAITGGDEGSIFAMGALLRGIGDMCQSIGVTPVIAHHTKRSSQDNYSPGELSDAAWAGFSEFMRQWILVKPRARYEPGTGRHELCLSVGGSAGHGGVWALNINEGTRQDGATRFWDVELLGADELQEAEANKRQRKADDLQTEKLDGIKQKLINALAKYPSGETKNVIRDLAGVSGTLANAAFAALLNEGVIEPCQITKGNRKTPIGAYRITPSEGAL